MPPIIGSPGSDGDAEGPSAPRALPIDSFARATMLPTDCTDSVPGSPPGKSAAGKQQQGGKHIKRADGQPATARSVSATRQKSECTAAPVKSRATKPSRKGRGRSASLTVRALVFDTNNIKDEV